MHPVLHTLPAWWRADIRIGVIISAIVWFWTMRVESAAIQGQPCPIVTLTTGIRAGGDAGLLVLLPEQVEDCTHWQLYASGWESPVATGRVDRASVAIHVKMQLQKSGSYIPYLVVWKSNIVVLSAKSDPIVVRDGLGREMLAYSCGPVVGASIAIVVFIFQEQFRNFLLSRKKRKELHARLAFVAQRLYSAIQNRARNCDIPEWLKGRDTSEWSSLLSEAQFMQTVDTLEEVCRRVNAGMAVDPELVKAVQVIATVGE